MMFFLHLVTLVIAVLLWRLVRLYQSNQQLAKLNQITATTIQEKYAATTSTTTVSPDKPTSSTPAADPASASASASASAPVTAPLVCPYGYTGSTIPADHPPIPSVPTLTLIELAEYDGVNKDKIYICIKDAVYDVTSARSLYGKGGPLSILAGHDITRSVALSTHTPVTSVAELCNLRSRTYDGLTFDQLQWLETVARDYQKRFPLVAYLAHVDAAGDPGAQSMSTSSTVHTALDADDIDALKRELDAGADVNALCERTRMTALHKAIEKGSLPLVELLLSHGASLISTAELYDNATPLQLAQQFQFQEAIDAIEKQHHQQQQQ